MGYLIFDTEEEAQERSRLAWEQHLGRPKHPDDVTEFMWPTTKADDGSAFIDVSSDEAQAMLTPEDTVTIARPTVMPVEKT